MSDFENEDALEPIIAPSEVGDSIEPAVDEGGAVEEEYKPNFSYTHHDKEHEFPEWVRDAITSKDQEDELRNWVTASAGLPELKDKLGHNHNRAGELENQLVNLTGGLSDIKNMRDAGDLRGVFKRLGIKDKDFMKFAVEMAKEDELPEDERNFKKQRRDFEEQQEQWEMQQEQSQQNQFNAQVENDYNKLMGTINTGKYGELNKAMAAAGINMAEEVCLAGQNHEFVTKTVPPMEDCIDRVVEKFNHLLDYNKLKQNPVIQQQQQQATLPTLKGNNSTAVKPRITSIADIEKAYDAVSGD